MRDWAIIVPEDLINLDTNPSFELDTAGATAVGGSIARSSTYQRRGVYSLAVTPTSGTTDGVYKTVSLETGKTYTWSLDFRGVAGVAYKIYFANTSGTLKGTAYTFTPSGDWQRVQVTWACDSTTTYRLYATKNSHASTGVFYIDGSLCAVQDTASDVQTYFDGDTKNCKWSGSPHSSSSSRPITARNGGRETFLDDLGLVVTAVTGIGMAPQKTYIEQSPHLAGAIFRGQRTEARTVQLAISAMGASKANLHGLRSLLIDLVKPEAKPGNQEFCLRYYGANNAAPVEMWARYDDGAGYSQPFASIEKIVLRVLATDPWWYEDGDQGIELTTQSSFTASYIAKRVSGVWAGLGTLNGDVLALVIGPDGCLYAGGAFTTAGGTTVNYVAKYDGTSWSALGSTAGMNATVRALAFGPDGSLYAGGDFTQAGGTTVYYVAKWNGSAWSAVGSSPNVLNAAVYALVIGRDGTLYAGGAFTTYNTAAYCYYFASWNGSIWNKVGDGFSAAVNCLAVGIDGAIYAGGDFLTNHATTTTFNCVAKLLSGTWSALSTGLSGGTPSVKTLAIGVDGALYVGGTFTTAGGVSAANITRWTGMGFSALGDGTNGIVRRMMAYSGNLLVFGSFTTAGGLAAAGYAAVWNGTAWAHLDCVLPDGALAMTHNGDDLYIGIDSSGTAYASYQQTVTNNGSASAYPLIKIKRSGGTSARVQYLRNESTDETLWINYDLLDGETLTIDLREGQRTVASDFFGIVWSAMLKNSDAGEFHLQSGDNLIDAFVYAVGSPTITPTLQWRLTHVSVDGVA